MKLKVLGQQELVHQTQFTAQSRLKLEIILFFINKIEHFLQLEDHFRMEGVHFFFNYFDIFSNK